MSYMTNCSYDCDWCQFFIDACWIFFDSCYGTTTVACCKVDTRWKQRQGNGVGRAFPETEWPTLSVPDFIHFTEKEKDPCTKKPESPFRWPSEMPGWRQF